MSKTLTVVDPTMWLIDAERVLDERNLSAAPVVGADGTLLGILSLTDLLQPANVSAENTAPDTAAPQVGAYMITDVISMQEDQPLRDAAERMVHHRVHRVVVLRGAVPVGMVSTRDVLRVVINNTFVLPVRDVMTTEVETIDVGAPINSALHALRHANVHGLVVVDGDAPVGVFTQAEALRAKALPAALRALPVETVMSYQMLCLPGTTPLYRAAGQFVQTQVRRILVTTAQRLEGIVTGFDLVRVLRDVEGDTQR